jgi:hypothetical protein
MDWHLASWNTNKIPKTEKSVNVKIRSQNHADLLLLYQRNFYYTFVLPKQTVYSACYLSVSSEVFCLSFIKRENICGLACEFYITILCLSTQHRSINRYNMIFSFFLCHSRYFREEAGVSKGFSIAF